MKIEAEKTTDYLGGHPKCHEKIVDGELGVAHTRLAFSAMERMVSSRYGYQGCWIKKKVFFIPLEKIIGVRLDTAKNIGLRKALLVGVFAFGWKDKILAINFKDDLGMQNTIFFRGGKLGEIRHQIIAKRYTLRKKRKKK